MYSKLKTVSDLTTGKQKYNLTSCNFLTIFKQFFSSILRNADGFKIFLKIKFRKTQFINTLNTAPNTRLTAGLDSFSLTQLTKFIFRNSLTSMFIDINYFRCLTPPTETSCSVGLLDKSKINYYLSGLTPTASNCTMFGSLKRYAQAENTTNDTE